MIRKSITAAIAAVALTGCVTIPINEASLGLLDYALDSAPDSLESRAETGDGRAQYALSVVYRYGLNGVPRDGGRATALRAKAVAQRGYTPITQYIAGLEGKPGRTAIINIPRHDVSAYEASINDACAATLSSGAETPAALETCGGQASFLSLKARWTLATAR